MDIYFYNDEAYEKFKAVCEEDDLSFECEDDTKTVQIYSYTDASYVMSEVLEDFDTAGYHVVKGDDV